MDPIRPDLSQVDATVRAYIEALESEVERLRRSSVSTSRSRPRPEAEEDFIPPPESTEPAEDETTFSVLTLTRQGVGKRTFRHLYSRQRRGGMGVFDLETPKDEAPGILAIADAAQNLLVFTNQARAFRVPVSVINEAPVRSRGESILGKLNLNDDESLAAVLPDQAQGYVALVSQKGFVRLLRHHVFGEYMKPGTPLYDPRINGTLAAACWTPGDGDLFIATRRGKAIRFSEKGVNPQGSPGIRLGEDDEAVGICGVYEDSKVFLLSADGKGTIRIMDSFSANKAPGAGGKNIMGSDEVIFAAAVEDEDDIFIISRLGKIIRFRAEDVPPKDSVVQGVICMSLRSDECTAATVSPARSRF